jgi:4-hydroxybenzoate polyprenyltransferase
MFKTLKNFLNNLAYSNLLLSLNLSAITFIVLVLFGLPFHPLVISIPFLVTFTVYTHDKKFDKETSDIGSHDINDPGRSQFISKYIKFLFPLAVLSSLVALILTGIYSLKALSAVFLSLFLGIIYNTLFFIPKKIKAKIGFSRLKDIPFVKNLTVASGWTVIAIFLPYFFFSPNLNLITFLVVTSFVFIRSLINTTFFDLGDIKGDSEDGLKTLPVIFGFKIIRNYLLVLNTLAGAIILVATLNGYLPHIAHFINLITIYGYYYLLISNKTKDLTFICDVFVDGEYILVAFLAIVGLILFKIIQL